MKQNDPKMGGAQHSGKMTPNYKSSSVIHCTFNGYCVFGVIFKYDLTVRFWSSSF